MYVNCNQMYMDRVILHIKKTNIEKFAVESDPNLIILSLSREVCYLEHVERKMMSCKSAMHLKRFEYSNSFMLKPTF